MVVVVLLCFRDFCHVLRSIGICLPNLVLIMLVYCHLECLEFRL